jgi:hypothetical protein
MAVNDIFEQTWGWTIGTDDANNVVHFRQTQYDGVSSRPALCAILNTLVEAGIAADLLTQLSAGISLDTLDCFVVNSDTDFAASAPALNGSLLGEIVPHRSAPVVTKTTGLRGRSFRGRMFLPSPIEGQQNGGVMTGAHVANLQTFVDNLRIVDDGAGNFFRMTVYSPTLSDPGMSVFIDNLINVLIVRPVLGSLRGRQDVS